MTVARRDISIDQAILRRVAGAPPFEILRARFRRQRFVPHLHAEFAIGVVESGNGTLRHAGGIGHHPAGSIILLPPGLAHQGEAGASGMAYRMFYLPNGYLVEAAERAGAPFGMSPRFRDVVLHDHDLAGQIVELHAMLEAGPQAAASRRPQLDEMLRTLVSRHADGSVVSAAKPSSASQGLQAVRRVLDEGFMHRVSVEELSRMAGLTPGHLIRAFRRAYGMPPYAYVAQQRVHYARHLIETGVPISVAAAVSGFADQSHLTRRFKCTLGITPGALARSVRPS